MKTVLIDNSLCSLTINDDAEAADINRYICALAQTGVRYVEIDFRALMKLRRLPDGIGYIFRPVDPMFMKFTEVFRFDYVALTVTDIMKYRKIGIPVMLSIPLPGSFIERSPREIVQCAGDVIGAPVTSVRIRGDYPLITAGDADRYIDFMKRRAAIPVDICPTNNCRTALNTAMNFYGRGADSVTVAMGSSERYCSLEELMITFLTLYGGCPDDLNMSGLCRAAALHTRVFKNSLVSEIPELVKVFEDDFRLLLNADTGEQVAAGSALPVQRRFSQTFANFLKGIKCDWKINGDDPMPAEAAESYAAALYNQIDDKRRSYGRTPPFLN